MSAVRALVPLFCLIILLQGACARAAGTGSETGEPETQTVFAGPPPTLERAASLRGSHILSPKSALFSPDGGRFYVNALEGEETLVFDSASLTLLGVISHDFGEKDAGLFEGAELPFPCDWNTERAGDRRDIFAGKPVEAVLSHGGRWLWITYYRRSWDRWATSPSALALVDTASSAVVRVFHAGPLPKMLALSPDGKTLAVTHWGDNSIGLLDISGDDPRAFHWKGFLVDGSRQKLAGLRGDRDKICGHCLRGTAFSADGRYLFAGRMHNGGITVFDLENMTRLGVFMGVDPTPRHMVLSRDGRTLYVSCAYSGTLNALDVEKVLAAVRGELKGYHGRSLRVGRDVRTLALSPDGRYCYLVSNREARLIVADLENWRVIQTLPASPYPVGLAVSPDGRMVLTTAQGRQGRGGHVVDVFRAQGAPAETGRKEAPREELKEPAAPGEGAAPAGTEEKTPGSEETGEAAPQASPPAAESGRESGPEPGQEAAPAPQAQDGEKN